MTGRHDTPLPDWGESPSRQEVEQMGFDSRTYGDAIPPWHSWDIARIDGYYVCQVAYRTIDPTVDIPPPWYVAGSDEEKAT